ncbi:ArsS family sensor histidine kinase [Aliarcobacter cibarius]|jgi:two-component system, OmpR family, sensor kinase|uniref:histidine kinase n=1 Tax=Aliarcobacter cibarius TaxID=255507 RepID=A0ABY2V509_9BACT|nr:ArsS family sensor histidine kinase [Aliarcobacter cibarius]QEZ90167.1 two-component system sensor histidine kinase [Aliarcobacter cibarius]TLT00276.1 HAMP domain-containing histidine kinase [Aliarcobacter cibarius]TLT00545.1 HAMP domain-containing histidine kinase [Aliarcobacter cibarius]TLT05182.1 HAMP domain-containing histidine kinase [Aliarcobacter cibarius]
MSIFKKLTLLFILSFVLMTIIGLWIDNINSKRVDNFAKEKYLKVIDDIFKNIENKNYLDSLILKNGLEKVNSLDENSLEIIYFQDSTFGNISILKYKSSNIYILKIGYLDEQYIFKTLDEQSLSDKTILNALVFLDISVLLLIFLYILKLLTPLKTITKDIKTFANGNLSTRINIKSDDEIGTLANSFNSMASSLENSIKTREELLRDIGHELRTPIAKGKFAIEKIDNFSQKELLKKIFYDLESLTNELIELEKLNITKLNLTTFSAETLVLESLGKLYLEDETKVDIEIIEDFKIEADLDYLSVALKNLIDNAIKYAISLPIVIKVCKDEISVLNNGEKLLKDFEYYLKPFTQELVQRDGFGLGLSIVKKIIDRHNFELKYTYENSFNTFRIYFK